ncbi:MAG: hypothetical protein ACHBN1_03695 [Heteroscytonema crispum UTEX LB 1556]
MNDIIENQKVTNQSWSTSLAFEISDLGLRKLSAFNFRYGKHFKRRYLVAVKTFYFIKSNPPGGTYLVELHK